MWVETSLDKEVCGGRGDRSRVGNSRQAWWLRFLLTPLGSPLCVAFLSSRGRILEGSRIPLTEGLMIKAS